MTTTHAEFSWKWTEDPQYAIHVRRICERYEVAYEDFDEVRTAIEDTVLDDPIAASVPVNLENVAIRRFVYEDHPAYWDVPTLVIVFRIEPPTSGPREVTGLEIWTEEELAEQDAV